MSFKAIRELGSEWRSVTSRMSEARAQGTPDPDARERYTVLAPRVRQLKRDYADQKQAELYLGILRWAGFHPVAKHRPDKITVRAF